MQQYTSFEKNPFDNCPINDSVDLNLKSENEKILTIRLSMHFYIPY